MIKLVVFDFDGTVSDIRGGHTDFDARYVRALADALGLADLRSEWAQAKEAVKASAPEAGWTIDGKAVAPADADPYTLASEAGRSIMARHAPTLSKEHHARVLSEIYHVAYDQAEYAFRPDARVVLGVLRKLGNVAVRFVTNSVTHVAENRLRQRLFPEGLGDIAVRGSAKKFMISEASTRDPRFDQLPAEKKAEGLARPILLKRGRYFDVLKKLWAETGADPSTTLVCGDVYELDLALPAALGTHIHFILRHNTYPYEHAEVASLGARGGESANLLPILERIG